MIPTVIVVHDDNHYLEALTPLFQNITRVFVRSSLDGEKLYGMFEGVLYFDEKGQKQLIRKDDYGDIVFLVLAKLKTLDVRTMLQLKNYLVDRDQPTVSQVMIDRLDQETQDDLQSYLRDVYGES